MPPYGHGLHYVVHVLPLVLGSIVPLEQIQKLNYCFWDAKKIDI